MKNILHIVSRDLVTFFARLLENGCLLWFHETQHLRTRTKDIAAFGHIH